MKKDLKQELFEHIMTSIVAIVSEAEITNKKFEKSESDIMLKAELLAELRYHEGRIRSFKSILDKYYPEQTKFDINKICLN
jgi:hypothetical protein